jgi:hypothetical protein
MTRLGIVAVGLALVVGIVVGGMAGNPFDERASAAPPVKEETKVREQNLDANGNIRVHEQGTVNVNVVSSGPVGPEGMLVTLFDNEPFGASETKSSPWVGVAGCREFEVFINAGVASDGNQALWSPDAVTSIAGPKFSGSGLDSNPTNAFSFSGFAPYAGFQLKNKGVGQSISAWLLCAP